MLEWVTVKLGASAVNYAAGGAIAVVVAWVLKKIPNNAIKAKFGALMYGLGVAATLGLSKWKITKKLWNATIEPFIVDAIDNIAVTGIRRFVEGLRSDNK